MIATCRRVQIRSGGATARMQPDIRRREDRGSATTHCRLHGAAVIAYCCSCALASASGAPASSEVATAALSNATLRWWDWVVVRVANQASWIPLNDSIVGGLRDAFVHEWDPDLFDWCAHCDSLLCHRNASCLRLLACRVAALIPDMSSFAGVATSDGRRESGRDCAGCPSHTLPNLSTRQRSGASMSRFRT